MEEVKFEPIPPNDILENQENILIDDEVLEIEADEEGDPFADMPYLQDLSDDEDDSMYFYYHFLISFLIFCYCIMYLIR